MAEYCVAELKKREVSLTRQVWEADACSHRSCGAGFVQHHVLAPGTILKFMGLVLHLREQWTNN